MTHRHLDLWRRLILHSMGRLKIRKCTWRPNYLPSYCTNTFTRKSWILMAKCESFLWHFQGSSSYWREWFFSWRRYSPPTVPFLPSSYGQSLLNPDSFTSTSTFNGKSSVLNTSKMLLALPLKIPGTVHDKRDDELPLIWQKMSSIMILNGILYVQRYERRWPQPSHRLSCNWN